MTDLFLKIVNMSLSAGVVIPAVILARFLLRGAPKRWSYLLWSAVGFRLCCPVSIQSVLSIFRAVPVKPAVAPAGQVSAIQYIPTFHPEIDNIPKTPAPVFNNGLPGPTPSYLISPSGAVTATPPVDPAAVALVVCAMVWGIGIAVLLLYTVVSYLGTRRTVSTAVRWEGNVWRSDQVGSPFILGFVRPRIYIPFGLEGEALAYVLEHERYHIRRGDHIMKALAFGLLALHWFNPLVWLAFHLMGKDMEMSCDEHVLGQNRNIRKAYSATLLSFASGGRFPSPSPLAFGETAVKTRIKNALSWKKPKTWVTLLAGVAALALVVSCAVNPTAEKPGESGSPVVTDGPSPSPVAESPVPVMMQVTIPVDWVAGLVEVESTVDRVSVYEKKSREDFRADFEKAPWPDYEHPDQVGMGWLCSIERVSEAEMLEMGVGDMSGVTFFGRDETGYYVRYQPTDVRFYRAGGTLDDPEGWQTWEKLQEWAATLDQAYLAQHPEVEPYLRTNTEADIFLTRAACWDLDLVLTDSATGQSCSAGNVPHARNYSARLAEDYTFEWVDVDTAKEVLTKPNLALSTTTQGEDYWTVEFWPGENFVRVAEWDMLMLFRATPRAGVTQPIGDVARAWLDEAQPRGAS